MEPSSTLNARLATRVRALRSERGLTLDALAERTGVSRSMISLVERGESSPTAAVLDRLAGGLGVTLAALFAEPETPEVSPLSRSADQRVWRDPGSGYVRKNLSAPGFPSRLELVEVVLPGGTRVAYDTPARAAEVDQQVWLIAGEVEIALEEAVHRLAPGDCLSMRLDGPVAFRNPGERDARYLVALAPDRPPSKRGPA